MVCCVAFWLGYDPDREKHLFFVSVNQVLVRLWARHRQQV